MSHPNLGPSELHPQPGPSAAHQPTNQSNHQPQFNSTPWEGSSTLHSYCYDYMRKRGWEATARAFAADAGIDEQSWNGPPIEAPQGLLYEWWTVFWDVFIARNQKDGHRNLFAEGYADAIRQKQSPVLVQFAANSNQPPLLLPRSLAHPARQQSGPPPPLGQNSKLPPHRTGPGAQNHVLEQQQIQQQLMQQRAAAGLAGPGGPGQAQGPMRGGPGGQGMQVGGGQYGQGPGPGVGGGSPAPGGGPMMGQHGAMGPPQQPGQLQQQYSQGQPGHQQQPGPGQGPGPGQMQGYPSQGSIHGSPHLAHAVAPGYNNQPGRPPPQQIPGSDGRGPHAAAFQQTMQQLGLSDRNPHELLPEELGMVAGQMRRIGAMPPAPQGPPGQPGQPLNGQVQAQQAAMRANQARMAAQHQQSPGMMQQPGQQMVSQPGGGIQRMMPPGGGPPPPNGATAYQSQQQQQMILAQQRHLQNQQAQLQAKMAQAQGLAGDGHHQFNPNQAPEAASPAYSAMTPGQQVAQSPYGSVPTPLPGHLAQSPATTGAGSPGSFNQPLPPTTTGAPAGRGAGNKRGAPGAAKMSPAPSKRGAVSAAAAAANGPGGAGAEDPSPRSRKRAKAGANKEEEPPTPNGTGPPQTPSEAPSPAVTANGAMGPPGQRYGPSPSPGGNQHQLINDGGEHTQMMIGANGGPPHPDPNHPSNQNGGISRPSSSASNYLAVGHPQFNQHDPNGRSPQPPPGAGQQGYPGQSPQLHVSIPPGNPSNGGSYGMQPSAGPDSAKPFAGANQPPPPSRPLSQPGGGPPQQPMSTQPSPMGMNPQQLGQSPHLGAGQPLPGGMVGANGVPGGPHPGQSGGMDPSVFGGGAGLGGGADDMFADLGNLGDMDSYIDFDFESMLNTEAFGADSGTALS